jgi:hypothetical protein
MKDVKGYIKRLDKSMTRAEKLFFLDKVHVEEFDYIVDFGGANGRLLYEVERYMNKKHLDKEHKVKFINVEKNNDMECGYAFQRAYIHALDLNAVKEFVKGKKVFLILSSVLHECDKETLNALENFINDYVACVSVRDMYFKDTMPLKRSLEHLERMSKTINKLPLKMRIKLEEISENCTNRSYFYNDFVFYEFLLKYTYDENWETEVNEQYFNSLARNFIDKIRQRNLVFYEKYYILPYKKRQVKKDFGFTMKCQTHIQLIANTTLKRKPVPLPEGWKKIILDEKKEEGDKGNE